MNVPTFIKLNLLEKDITFLQQKVRNLRIVSLVLLLINLVLLAYITF